MTKSNSWMSAHHSDATHTHKFVFDLQEKIFENPEKSMRQLAFEPGVSKRTVE